MKAHRKSNELFVGHDNSPPPLGRTRDDERLDVKQNAHLTPASCNLSSKVFVLTLMADDQCLLSPAPSVCLNKHLASYLVERTFSRLKIKITEILFDVFGRGHTVLRQYHKNHQWPTEAPKWLR